ncbi:endonuclease V [Candidatus Woesearchaeota archaeon]|nr:endonuclease V [Candidatus Woesearchaeota archaeon]MBW2978969.1 endonuclease V [Candidatus Woesearchaeota archaeon]
MKTDTKKLRDIQRKIAKEVRTSDELKKEDIKKIAGFETSFFNDKIICAAVLLDAKTFEILEKKHTVSKAPMPYIPGFLAFREGPAIMQTYYSLELEPDVMMISGHGAAHPLKCGLASYVGVELGKATIGIAKKILVGELKKGKIVILNETRGEEIITRKHAKPLYVSAGHLISLKTSVGLVKKTIIEPHKMPEPLHEARKYVKKIYSEVSGK